MQKSEEGFVKNFSEVEEMPMPGGAAIRWLITHKDGAPTFSMRLITVGKGKSTPYHSHDYEHEIFVVSGKCMVTLGEHEKTASEGDFIFIPPNLRHGMTATEDMRIICIVPLKAAKDILGE
jgi:Uncharacterized conserved protein, contains double-stranded beta-helix domain